LFPALQIHFGTTPCIHNDRMSSKKGVVYARLILLTKTEDNGPIFQVRRPVVVIGRSVLKATPLI
jgi:hypothetical protein